MASNLTPRELVLEKYPSAFVDDDDGTLVVTTQYLHMGLTRQEVNEIILGRGESESTAWEDAAKCIEQVVCCIDS